MSIRRHPEEYWRGVRDGAPFVLVVCPFALLFGVVATESGLDLTQTMGMSVLVIAGAAQFATLQLLAEQAPLVVAVLTGLAVNLRMAMYSASLTPHLGAAPLGARALAAYFMVDQVYAMSIQRFVTAELTLGEKLAYYFGVVTPVCPLWYLCSWVGAVVGGRIPPEFALDFAVPITFIAMVAPMLRGIPNLAAAVVAVGVALVARSLPYNLGLLVAGGAGMCAGVLAERLRGEDA
ncbi:MAG: AzlC family ABC transporter permease [Pseudomonadales bacterium]|jgi:predicted branched-subunit amino acid permease|nr:AzlC family ABC transporter permease [Pseudomonadales bacterium]